MRHLMNSPEGTGGPIFFQAVLTTGWKGPRPCLDRCGLSGSSAEGDKFRSHRHAFGDFHPDYCFERFEFPGV